LKTELLLSLHDAPDIQPVVFFRLYN